MQYVWKVYRSARGLVLVTCTQEFNSTSLIIGRQKKTVHAVDVTMEEKMLWKPFLDLNLCRLEF